MDTPSFNMPWNTPAAWTEANASLVAAIAKHSAGMTDLFVQAHQIRQRLETLFPLMDSLCRETCPDCSDVCCRRAWIWADFRDLLFYHLADVTPPYSQLIGTDSSHCRFAGPRGCRLDRIRRPFVCTWYLCPAQTSLLDHQPAEKCNLSRILEQIKSQRRKMEMAFIYTVA